MSDIKAKVVPIRFKEINARELGEYKQQLEILNAIYGDVSEFMDTVVAGLPL